MYILFLFTLLSVSILMGMEKKEAPEQSPKPKNIAFSAEALERLSRAEEAISVQPSTSPPKQSAIPRSPGQRIQIRPGLSPIKGLGHRDSAPDVEGAESEGSSSV